MAISPDSFLASVDPRGGFVKFAQDLITISRRDKDVAERLSEVKRWLANPIIDAEMAEAFTRIRTVRAGRRTPSSLPIGDEARALITIMYTKAVEQLRTNSFSPDYVAAIPFDYERLNKILSPKFLGVLLVETEVRAIKDPRFAEILDTSALEVEIAIKELGRMSLPSGTWMMDPDPSPEGPRDPGGGGGGGGRSGGSSSGPCCTFEINKEKYIDACLPDGAYYACVGLWIAAAVIIVIIIIAIIIGGGDEDEDNKDNLLIRNKEVVS